MLIVTAGSSNYPFKKTIKYNELKSKEFGYNFIVFNLGGLGFGIDIDDVRVTSRFRRVKSAMKPELIKRAVSLSKDNHIVWIDGDATLIRPIDEIKTDSSWDVGVTVRNKVNNKKSHYINAGVIFLRRSAVKFIERWIAMMPSIPNLDTKFKPQNYSDQQILEESLLLPAIKQPLWDLVGQIRKVHGFNIKFFPCEIYNNFAATRVIDGEGPGKAKILHFKGHRMNKIVPYHEKFLA